MWLFIYKLLYYCCNVCNLRANIRTAICALINGIIFYLPFLRNSQLKYPSDAFKCHILFVAEMFIMITLLVPPAVQLQVWCAYKTVTQRLSRIPATVKSNIFAGCLRRILLFPDTCRAQLLKVNINFPIMNCCVSYSSVFLLQFHLLRISGTQKNSSLQHIVY